MRQFFRTLGIHRSHPSDGELRQYQDGQLPGEARVRLEAHLRACRGCRERAELLSARSTAASRSLNGLAQSFTPMTARLARARLENLIAQKEKHTMFDKIFSRASRPAWVILAVIGLLAISLAFQPVRALAIDFLGLFRVQQVAVIPFNPANLPDNLDDPQFEQLFSDSLQIEQLGEVQEASDSTQASQVAGFPVRLPAEMQEDPRLTVQPAGRVTFKVDLPRIRALLAEIGRQDIVLPDDLDGATVTAELPVSVTAAFGNCRFDAETAREAGQDPDDRENYWNPSCSVLVQVPSPSISAPPGLDIDAIGKAYLMMTGMTAEEAETFSQTIDWSTTLLIPIPNYASSEKVQVDGVEGVLVQQSPSHSNRPRYALIWVKDGVVYALEGQGSRADALRVANSLQ